MRSVFDIVSITDSVITLQDLDGAVSITNDAEDVLVWANTNYPGKDVHYYDTYGELTWIHGDPVIFEVLEHGIL